jgi:hypothetical protein
MIVNQLGDEKLPLISSSAATHPREKALSAENMYTEKFLRSRN